VSDRSAIEWTDASWNPIRARNTLTGKIGWHCTHASEACRFCYAEGFNTRLGTGEAYKPGALVERQGPVKVFLDDKMLQLPLRWKKPRKIFVCSMTDLFADFVTDEWLDKIFAVMALCPQHTFQVLTKRPERMRAYCSSLGRHHETDRVSLAMKQLHAETGYGANGAFYTLGPQGWHFKNIWLGVSAERQQEFNERWPHLRDTPAAIRFISYEPALGRLDACEALGIWQRQIQDDDGSYRRFEWERSPVAVRPDWFICGGESGPNARPMHPAWAHSLCDQCAAADVPFFFKQWGEWAPHKPVAGGDLGGDVRAGRVRIVHPSGRSGVEIFQATGGRNTEPGSRYMRRVGKKAAGRLLDGKEYSEFPQSAPAAVQDRSPDLTSGSASSLDRPAAGVVPSSGGRS
jgi:protein gp37